MGEDFSVTNAVVVIATLVGMDVGMSFVKEKLPRVDRAADSLPVVILQDGRPIEHRMVRARIDVSDILAAGRVTQGVERLDQIKYAVLEQGGGISIIPYPSGS